MNILPKTDTSNIDVPDREDIPNLPYIYHPEKFTSDIQSAFRSAAPRKLKDIVKDWQNEARDQETSLLEAKIDAVFYDKFFHRFNKSKLKENLLKAAGGDCETATSALLAILSRKNKKGMMRALGGSLLPGDCKDAEAIAQSFRINELVQQLKLEYESYSRRSTTKRETVWPENIDIDRLRSYSASDIARITTSDALQDDDLFFHHLSSMDVRQVTYYEEIPQPQHFVMLLDVSGSMFGRVGQEYSRNEYATASAISLLQNALKGGNKVTLIEFGESTFPPVTGSTEQVANYLLNHGKSAGGTDIDNALREAVKHDPDEIIIVTDGGDEVTERTPMPLTTYFCGGDNEQLQKISNKYVKVS